MLRDQNSIDNLSSSLYPVGLLCQDLERPVKPTNLGSAYVPPQPGSRPSFTSGKPGFVFATSTRLARHAIAHSKLHLSTRRGSRPRRAL